MKNQVKAVFMGLAAVFLVGCGELVEVEPASVGKVLTKAGYLPETVPPSRFRLPACFAYCDKMVTLEVSDSSLKEVMPVFMPKDKLNLTVEIRGTYSIPNDDRTIDSIYDRIKPARVEGNLVIPSSKIYDVYGRQAVRGIVRSEVTKYTIQEILANRESIGLKIHEQISKKLAASKTPMHISRFELADLQPPKIIVEAQEAAKEREIGIQKAEAEAQIRIVEAERELEIAKADRLVEREKAEAIAEQNRIAAASITPKVLAYKKLETMERVYSKLAESDNVVIVPLDSSGVNSATDDAVLAKLLGKEIR